MVARGLADTSVFIAVETGRRLNSELVPDELGVSAITIGELRAGVLAAPDVGSRDQRLATLLLAMESDALPVTTEVADAWAALRLALRDSGQKMPVNDSWIAATALAHDVPLVTQDSDYVEVGGLRVIRI